MTLFATSSITSALSLVNGRGMSVSERMVAPLTETSKQPVRGFSSLIFTVAPGKPAFTRASSLEALVLNAPQLLHASILTTQPPSADEASPLERIVAFSTAFEGDFLAFLSMVFFGGMIVDFSDASSSCGKSENLLLLLIISDPCRNSVKPQWSSSSIP